MARRRSETPRTSAHSQLPRRERGEEEVKYEGHKAFERSEERGERTPASLAKHALEGRACSLGGALHI